jgi:hypothetical protein
MKPIPYNEPVFTFAETLSATDVEASWLRTFMQRDKEGRIGSKHRTGRLLFSLSDIAAISLLYRLNARMRIAPAAAWEILEAANRILRNAENAASKDVHIGFDDKGGVLIWTRGVDGDNSHDAHPKAITTWNDNADENQYAAFMANHEIHLVVPMKAIFAPVAKASRISNSWPEAASPAAGAGDAQS